MLFRSQQELAASRRTRVASKLNRLQLELKQAEAAARLQVIRVEMEARSAEIAVLVDATGSASNLLKTDRAVLQKMRHGDLDVSARSPVVRRPTGPKKKRRS